MSKRETKWILSYANAFELEAHAIYDTAEQLLEQLREDYGDPEMTMETIMDREWQSEGEMSIEECQYIPCPAEQRDRKINEVVSED
jgi:hypothetical protein